ncbi:MAG: ABC transporter permease [Acidobacteria bacterium]|nr:ABC transporter permease [Acidobacteriota bacterium]
MSSLLQDLKYSLRGIGRRPGHTALIVLTLAIGLGVNTVAFSSVNALLFRPFHITNADKYGWVFAGPQGDSFSGVSLEMFEALRARTSTLEALVAEGRMPLAAAAAAGPEQVWGLAVSSNYFSVVQAPIVAGRALSPTDTAAGAVPILISERYWRNHWNAASDLTSIRPVMNGQLTSVIGVVADSFQGPGGIFEPHLWFPLDASAQLRLAITPGSEWLTMMATPAAGASARQIGAEVEGIVRGVDTVSAEGRTPGRERRGQYVPISDGHPEARALGAPAAMAMAAVGLVLLIACFNVAGLILARSAERQRELGLRTALGASRMRLTRQLLVEGLVLASIAGTAALVLAAWSEALLGGLSLPAPIPQRLHFTMDWRMVAFTAALVIVAAAVPVLTPAWQVFRTNPIGWLKAGTAGSVGGSARARRGWVSLQVAGSTVFLTLALMFVTSYVAGLRTDLGFNTSHVALLQVSPTNFSIAPERQRALVTDLVSRLKTAPAVEQVSLADRTPFQIGVNQTRLLSTDGRNCDNGGCVSVVSSGVSAAFFETMEIPLLAGRLFDDASGADAETAVISAATAEALWPGRSPLGEQIHESASDRPRQVIGVVADIVLRLDRPNGPSLYRPITDEQLAAPVTVVARSRVDADAAAALLRSTWRDLDPTLPPATVQTMDQRMELPLWPSRVGAAFFATCGLLAVVLVTVGLFGVTYYAVAQRTREFGIRLALGATGPDLRRLVLGESMRLIMPGLIVGLAGAAALAALAQSALIGVTALDPQWYAAALALQIAVALLASWSPARRASLVAPHTSLRSD